MTWDDDRPGDIVHEAPRGHYRSVVIDPPWPGPGASPSLRGGAKQRLIPYSTMTGIQIASLPVGEIASPDAKLFIWATSRSVGDAFLLCQSWGFGYAGLLVWKKPPGLGMHVRHECEFVVMGRRQGAYQQAPRDTPRQVHEWPRGAHSEKPEEAYALFRKISVGPRIDIFNRRPIPGFDRFGNEAESPLGLAAQPS